MYHIVGSEETQRITLKQHPLVNIAPSKTNKSPTTNFRTPYFLLGSLCVRLPKIIVFVIGCVLTINPTDEEKKTMRSTCFTYKKNVVKKAKQATI